MWKEIAPAHKWDHPNICQVYRAATVGGRVMLVTDLLDGSPLDYEIGGKPLEIGLVLSYAFQIASALEASHGKGILHLGLNPANIFISSQGLKLLDFGLAGPMSALFPDRKEEVALAFAGSSGGNCTYLSPEQAAGVAVDARSDLFSLGTVIYEMATGAPAFSSTKPNRTPKRLLENVPTSATAINPVIPQQLESIILKAIATERELRYQTASQMLNDLLAIMKVESLIDLEQYAAAGQILLARYNAEPHNRGLERALSQVQSRLNRIQRSNHIRHLCWQAEEAAASKRYAEAIEIYSRAVMVDPSAHVPEGSRKSLSTQEQERAGTMKEIREKIKRIRELANMEEHPPWIVDSASPSHPTTSDQRLNAPSLCPGDMLRSYRIVRILELRGETELYEAIDASSETRVAIEVQYAMGSDNTAEILLKQIASMYRLKHPNLCAIYGGGEHNGAIYVVMEYLPGAKSLENILAFGEILSLEATIETVSQVCEAIEYAQQNGLTDLKVDPSRIQLLPDGRVKLSRYWHLMAETTLTKDSGGESFVGYISPERLKGALPDVRSEIYAAGAVLFHLLTGEQPFSGSDGYLVHQVLHDEVPSLRELGKDFPAGLDSILRRSLAKDPVERYQTANGMAEDLSRVIKGLNLQPGAARTDGFTKPARIERPTAARPELLPMPAARVPDASVQTESQADAFTKVFGTLSKTLPIAPSPAGPGFVGGTVGPGSFTRMLSLEQPVAPATTAHGNEPSPQPDHVGPARSPDSDETDRSELNAKPITDRVGITKLLRMLDVASHQPGPVQVGAPASSAPSIPGKISWTQTFASLSKPEPESPSASAAAPAEAVHTPAAAPRESTRILDASRMREMAKLAQTPPGDSAASALQNALPTVPTISGPLPLAPPISSASPDAPSSELLDRTLDLAFASSVPVFAPVEILALLRLPVSNSLSEILKEDRDTDLFDAVRSRGLSLEFLRDSAGRLKPIDVTMRITAPDFKPSRMEKKVRVRPDRDCERQSFLVTPQQTGVLRVEFDLLIDDLTIASQVLRTQSEASDGLSRGTDQVVISVPLSLKVLPRRRWARGSAIAAAVLLAVLLPAILMHMSSLKASVSLENRGFATKAGSIPQTNASNFKNYALLFATDDYRYWPRLNNPIADANTISGELRENYGYSDTTPQVISNPTRDQIVDTLHEYAEKSYGPNDQLFIYFAGHGFYDERENEGFLVGMDSRSTRDDASHSSYLDFSRLARMLNSIPVKHIFVVLDVCYGGAFDERVTQWSGQRGDEYDDVSPEKVISRKLAVKGRLYLTSGAITTVPDGRPGEHSPFARRFIESLRTYGGNKQLLTARRIATDVEKIEPEPRFGEFGNSEPGADFLFIPK